MLEALASEVCASLLTILVNLHDKERREAHLVVSSDRFTLLCCEINDLHAYHLVLLLCSKALVQYLLCVFLHAAACDATLLTVEIAHLHTLCLHDERHHANHHRQ